MSSWTDGYVADIGYTHDFFRELAPTILNFVALARGQFGPDPAAPLAYAELGCGQGFTTNLLAAANPLIQFYGNDFNPAHIAGAQRLAAEAGTPNVHFYDHSFATFASEPGLPASFDIISLHGIYSWVSEENRKHIVDFIGRKLKPGGLVYVSYNAMPGWAALMPLRRLMSDHGALSSGPNTPSKVNGAIAFLEKMQGAKAAYFLQNPKVEAHLERMKSHDRVYLAHEYFNRESTTFYFADVASDMAEAKLTYLGPAMLLEHLDQLNLTPEHQAILRAEADPVRRETLRDYMTNQQFRRDVYVKGAVPHSVASSEATWNDLRFALSSPRARIGLTVLGSLGTTAKLDPGTYNPILEGFSKGPVTVRQLTADPRVAALGWGSLKQALALLVGTTHLQPCLPAKDENKRVQRTKQFNAAVLKRSETSGALSFLASPVTGNGIMVDRITQLFLAARGSKQDPVQFAWNAIKAQGQMVKKEGKTLQTEEENVAELQARHDDFHSTQLPILLQLGIA